MKNEKYAPHQSSIGNTDANLMALLSYLSVIIMGWVPVLKLVPWVAPLIIWNLEKNSRFVKFHAFQSMILNIVFSVISLIGGVIYIGAIGGQLLGGNFFGGLFAGGILSLLLFAWFVVTIVFSIIAMVKAYGYEEYHIPVIGDMAEKQINNHQGF